MIKFEEETIGVSEEEDGPDLIKGEVKSAKIHACGCLEFSWPEYLTMQYEAWDAVARVKNAIVYELLQLDEPLHRSGLAQLRSCPDVFGKAITSLAWDFREKEGIKQWCDKLPSGVVARITMDTAKAYAKKRRGALQHLNDSLPLYKLSDAAELPIRADDVTLDTDPKDKNGFIIQFPVKRASKGKLIYVTLRIPPIRRDQYTSATADSPMPLLEKIRRNIIKGGGINISAKRRRASFRESKELPVKKDRFGNRYIFEPIINISYKVPVSVDVRGRRGMLFIHTDDKQFLVAQLHKFSKWNMHMKHIRRLCKMRPVGEKSNGGSLPPETIRDMLLAHDKEVKELREDAKAGYMGSRVKSVRVCEAIESQLDNFIKNVVRGHARLVVSKKFAEVCFFDDDKRYMPHFPWSVLRTKFAQAFAAEGIKFTYVSSFPYRSCQKEEKVTINGKITTKREWDYSALYLKLRTEKANQTKTEKAHDHRYRAEGQ